VLFAAFVLMTPRTARTDDQGHQGLTPADLGAHCESRFMSPFRALTGVAAPDLAALRANLAGPSSSVDVDTLIATVPDPVDSGLGYQFDAQLEAIVQALGVELPSQSWNRSTDSYNRDHSWLPWSDTSADPTDDQPRRSARCRAEWPGVVLFRGNGPQPNLLILLLVGESPISGLHVAAAERAFDISRELTQNRHALLPRGDGVALHPERVKVLGPTFTGSASSLRRVLQKQSLAADRKPVHVISGTATGPDVPAIVSPEGERSWIRFEATTISEQDLLCSFLFMARSAGARTGSGKAPNPVDGVAVLRESGTEFGATLAGVQHERSSCPLAPEIQLSFPFHISAIRDAYEEQDASAVPKEKDPSVERHTALEISLRSAARQDMEASQSKVTKFAQDLALANVLGEISREGVRWLGIQATDIADAIFLARKVRDVAPDVRLAFFTADALLLHPSFRSDLLGSLVITPYPFLGSNDFWLHERPEGGVVSHSHASFPNAAAEGTYNATLALRGARIDQLMEYNFIDHDDRPTQALPVWTVTVGRSSLVPLRMAPALDCSDVIYGNEKITPAELCAVGRSANQSASWAQFNSLRSLELHVDPDVTPPRLWNFIFALLAATCLLHAWFDRRVARELRPDETFPARIELTDGGLRPLADDTRLDRCIVRSKWHLYGFFAQLTLWIATSYFLAVYLIALATYARHDSIYKLTLIATFSLGLFLFTTWQTGGTLRRSFRDMTAFARPLRSHGAGILRRNGMPGPALFAFGVRRERDGLVPKLLLWLGFADANPPGWSVYVSYAQLRGVFWAGLVASATFTLGLASSLLSSTDAMRSWGDAVPALTLFALRNLPLTNGVSPGLPLLLTLACCYCWAVGRMARLRVLHGLARMSPDDGVVDCVSTPIRAILYPLHRDGHAADEGFTRVERSLINQVLRPNGHAYACTVMLASFLPLLLFTLKRPTTLERGHDTLLMFMALGLCALLVIATLIQMLRYWMALERMLKRLMVHPIGAAFQRVAAPVRADIDHQVSRAADDLQELAACADVYVTLLLAARGKALDALRSGASSAREYTRARLTDLRSLALGQGSDLTRDATDDCKRRDELGEGVVGAAKHLVSEVLLKVWSPAETEEPLLLAAAPGGGFDRELAHLAGDGATALALHPSRVPHLVAVAEQARPSSAPMQSERTRVSSSSYPPEQNEWLGRAEAYVATVVAVLVLRHVRQFKYFLYTTTACSLFLLGAVASYPFEPRRALMLCMWLLIGGVVAVSLGIFVQLDRDPLLSHLAGDVQSAGKVTWNSALAQRLFVWFLLPVISLLAAQYPSVSRHLMQLLEPFMRVLQ
jgi:hypothetical protein